MNLENKQKRQEKRRKKREKSRNKNVKNKKNINKWPGNTVGYLSQNLKLDVNPLYEKKRGFTGEGELAMTVALLWNSA